MHAFYDAAKLQSVTGGGRIRVRAQIAWNVPKILEISGVLVFYVGVEHGQGAVVNPPRGFYKPGHWRESHAEHFAVHERLVFRHVPAGVAVAAGIHRVNDLSEHPSKFTLGLDVHGYRVGEAHRRADDVGNRAVPGVGVFDAGHGLVAAAAAAVDITVGTLATVIFHRDLTGIFRGRCAGLEAHRGVGF